MPSNTRESANRKRLMEECRRAEEEEEALERGEKYVRSPLRKRGKKVENLIKDGEVIELSDDSDDEDFNNQWAKFTSATSTRTLFSEQEMKKMRKFNLAVLAAQKTVIREMLMSDRRACLRLEWDSTPYSVRVQNMLSTWGMSRGGSILNFSAHVIFPLEEGHFGALQSTKIPILGPSIPIPPSKSDNIAASDKTFFCVASYLSSLISALAPSMDDGCGPLNILLSCDWGSDNPLAIYYLMYYLSTKHEEHNYTICLSKCLVHCANNSGTTGSEAMCRIITKSLKPPDAIYMVWKRVQIVQHNSQGCDRAAQNKKEEECVVRAESSVGKVKGCRVAESRMLWELLGKGDPDEVNAKVLKGQCGRLGFGEKKLVWVVKDEKSLSSGKLEISVKKEMDELSLDQAEGASVKNESSESAESGVSVEAGLKVANDESAKAADKVIPDREPTKGEMVEIRKAIRTASLLMQVGSSSRWCTQAKMLRSYCRGFAVGCLSHFNRGKEIHAGKGLKVKMDEEFGKSTDMYAFLISVCNSFISRPSDDLIKSMLKTRDRPTRDMSARLSFVTTYEQSWHATWSDQTKLKEVLVFILSSYGDSSSAEITNRSDRLTWGCLSVLLSMRANLTFTACVEQHERIDRLVNDVHLTQYLTADQRRPVLERSITQNFEECPLRAGSPECLCTALTTAQLFEGSDDDDNEQFIQNVLDYCSSGSAHVFDSVTVERKHGKWVMVAKVLKTGSAECVGARVETLIISQSIAKFEKVQKLARQLKDRVSELENEKLTTRDTEVNYQALQEFKSEKRMAVKREEDSDKLAHRFKSEPAIWDEWRDMEPEEKEEKGLKRIQRLEAELEQKLTDKLEIAKRQLKTAQKEMEVEQVTANYWERVKSQAAVEFRTMKGNIREIRDRWSQFCTVRPIACSGAELTVMREQPGLLVQSTSRMQFAMGGSTEKCRTHLEPLQGDTSQVPDEGQIVVRANYNSDADECDEDDSSLSFRYLVAWACVSPMAVGVCELFPIEEEEEKAQSDGGQQYYVDVDKVHIWSGHSGVGAAFSLHAAMISPCSQGMGNRIAFSPNVVYSPSSERVQEEREEGKQTAPEKKTLKKFDGPDPLLPRHLRKKTKYLGAADRIYFCLFLDLSVGEKREV